MTIWSKTLSHPWHLLSFLLHPIHPQGICGVLPLLTPPLLPPCPTLHLLPGSLQASLTHFPCFCFDTATSDPIFLKRNLFMALCSNPPWNPHVHNSTCQTPDSGLGWSRALKSLTLSFVLSLAPGRLPLPVPWTLSHLGPLHYMFSDRTAFPSCSHGSPFTPFRSYSNVTTQWGLPWTTYLERLTSLNTSYLSSLL